MTITDNNRFSIWATLTLLIGAVWISGLYLQTAFERSEIKDLWLDESWSLEHSVQESSYLSTLINGPKGQLSGAPLDYFVIKTFDLMRSAVNSFGLPFNTYYRLPPILYLLLAGVSSAWLFWCTCLRNRVHPLIRLLQAAAILTGLYSAYFTYYLLYYAIEMRAYSLWVSLWLVAMSLFVFDRGISRRLIVILTLMALTMTSSLFVFFAFGVAYVILQWRSGKSFLNGLGAAIKPFLIPVAVIAYYLLIGFSGRAAMSPEEYSRYMDAFYEWWRSQELMPLLAALGLALASLARQDKYLKYIFGTLLGLFFFVPVLNYITLNKGVYFTHRHYLYLYTVFPVFFFGLAVTLPRLNFFNILQAGAVKKIAGLAVILLSVTASYFGYIHFKDTKYFTLNAYIPQSYRSFTQAALPLGDDDIKDVKTYLYYFKLINRYRPEITEAYGLRGYSLGLLGEHNESLKYYNEAISKDPDFFWYHYNTGILHARQGNTEESLNAFKSATELNPRSTLETILTSRMLYLPIIKAAELSLPDDLIEMYRNDAVAAKSVVRGLIKGENLRLRFF